MSEKEILIRAQGQIDLTYLRKNVCGKTPFRFVSSFCVGIPLFRLQAVGAD